MKNLFQKCILPAFLLLIILDQIYDYISFRDIATSILVIAVALLPYIVKGADSIMSENNIKYLRG